MANREKAEFVDLSHVIEHGMTTYPGLPGPHICDFWTREGSAQNYDDGSSFHIGRIDMVANTGTYLDAPFHRFADGKDVADLALERLANLPALVVRRPFEDGLETTPTHLQALDVRGKAVLVHTGWDRHWNSPQYGTDHPFLTEDAARFLAAEGALLVGIDSNNIDDTRRRSRPVHTVLLEADIPICEHLTGLKRLPSTNFSFCAVPPKIRGMGTFPVRAYGVVR